MSDDEVQLLLSIDGVAAVEIEVSRGQGDPHENLILTLTDGRRIRVGGGSSDHWVDITMWAQEA